jgi:hypothetical protein
MVRKFEAAAGSSLSTRATPFALTERGRDFLRAALQILHAAARPRPRPRRSPGSRPSTPALAYAGPIPPGTTPDPLSLGRIGVAWNTPQMAFALLEAGTDEIKDGPS